MRSISRREFMRKLTTLSLASASAGILASVLGCGKQAGTETSEPMAAAPLQATERPTTAVAGTPVETSTALAAPAEDAAATAVAATLAPAGSPTPAPPGAAYLAVARGESPEAIVRAAVGALGGIERFCQPGYDVIVKPNICNAYHSFEYASTTNPEVVATLVTMCLEAGAKRVRVMDYPFGGTAEAAYVSSGIGAAVEAAGGEMAVISPLRYQDVDIPGGQDLTRCVVYQDALDVDLLINVPIAKHHTMAGLTLGMKNLMGLIEDRPAIHRNFRQRLPDLVALFKPALTVMDAVRILVDHGPSGGNLEDVRLTNTVIASHDVVAVDAYSTSLFGQTPEDIPYILQGAAMGLGTADLASVDVQEMDV